MTTHLFSAIISFDSSMLNEPYLKEEFLDIIDLLCNINLNEVPTIDDVIDINLLSLAYALLPIRYTESSKILLKNAIIDDFIPMGKDTILLFDKTND